MASYKVISENPNSRFSDFACDKFDLLPSRKSVKKAIKKGELILNGEIATTGVWIKKNDLIELIDLELKAPKEYRLALDIIYEDEDIAVINKPSGISVSGNEFRTIENSLSGNITPSTKPDALKWPKPVHRLDNLTSGLLIIAKTINARITLGQMFEKKVIHKNYHAIVIGKTPSEGEVNIPISDKEASTRYETIQVVRSLKNDYLSLLKLTPLTGRTHQLRIHTSQSGFSILGDKLYGEPGKILKNKGLFLAATSLSFKHPITNVNLKLEINPPKNFMNRLANEQRRWDNYNESS